MRVAEHNTAVYKLQLLLAAVGPEFYRVVEWTTRAHACEYSTDLQPCLHGVSQALQLLDLLFQIALRGGQPFNPSADKYRVAIRRLTCMADGGSEGGSGPRISSSATRSLFHVVKKKMLAVIIFPVISMSVRIFSCLSVIRPVRDTGKSSTLACSCIVRVLSTTTPDLQYTNGALTFPPFFICLQSKMPDAVFRSPFGPRSTSYPPSISDNASPSFPDTLGGNVRTGDVGCVLVCTSTGNLPFVTPPTLSCNKV